jgi:hypothetical protein
MAQRPRSNIWAQMGPDLWDGQFLIENYIN